MNAVQALLMTLLLAVVWTPGWDRPAPSPGPAFAPAAGAPARAPAPPAGMLQMGRPPEPGPDTAVIDDLVEHYGPVVFDHGLHEQMSEITGDCSNCHHETPEGGPITGCAECHGLHRDPLNLDVPSLKGAFHRQCLSCHKEWSHANSCGFCHVEAGAAMHGPEDFGEFVGDAPTHLSPHPSYTYLTEREGLPVVTFHHEDHVQVFGLSCADCHLDDSCDRCHGAGTGRRVVERERDCVSCHGGSDCVACHDLGEKSRFDHGAATGWGLGASHAGIACAACHGPSHDAALPEPSALRCLACHEDAHGTGTVSEAGPVPLLGSHAFFECVSCHTGGDGDASSTCIECHDARTFPEDVPGLVLGR